MQEEARLLRVENQPTLDAAANFLTDRIKPLLAETEEKFSKPIHDAYMAHKSILALKKSITDPLEQAERIIRASIANFTTLEKQREAQRQRLAREEAERKAKVEREAEIERLRKEQAEAERILFEQREKQIEQAEANGNLAEVAWLSQAPIEVPDAGLADAIAAEPLTVTVPTVEPTITMPTGIGLRESRYTAEIFDPILLCASIGRKETPLEFIDLEPSTAMKAVARKAKRAWNAPPGCRAVEDTASGIIVRRK